MRMSRTPMRLVVVTVLALSLLTLAAPPARAATTYGCGCDVTQGFHHSSGGTATVGYLVSATIAGTTLIPDISVSDPQSGATTTVVGVMSADEWAGGASDPISLTAYISNANRQRLVPLTQTPPTNTAVTFNFANDVWDQVAKRYFVSFAPVSPPLRGQLSRNGGAVALQVASAPGPQSPPSYAMTMTVVPPASGGPQSIRVATSSTASAVKTWGIATAP